MMRTLSLSHLPPDHFCTYVHHDLRNAEPGEPHNHDFHELFWVEESEGVHLINGRFIPLQSGDLVLIRAPDVHSFFTGKPDGRLRVVNFAFHAQVWTYLRQRYFSGAPLFFSAPSLAARSYTLDEYQLTAIRQAASLLRSGLRDRLQAESFLLSVLAILKADRFNSELKAAPGWLRGARNISRANFAGISIAPQPTSSMTPGCPTRRTDWPRVGRKSSPSHSIAGWKIWATSIVCSGPATAAPRAPIAFSKELWSVLPADQDGNA